MHNPRNWHTKFENYLVQYKDYRQGKFTGRYRDRQADLKQYAPLSFYLETLKKNDWKEKQIFKPCT